MLYSITHRCNIVTSTTVKMLQVQLFKCYKYMHFITTSVYIVVSEVH